MPAIPGLHMGIALASALASYLNLWLLWRGVRRDGVYQREAGWAQHVERLAIACTRLVAVVLAGLLAMAGLDDRCHRASARCISA